MAKKIDKSKTIIKDDGVRIIFKNDIVYKVIYTKGVPPPLTNYQRKKLTKREEIQRDNNQLENDKWYNDVYLSNTTLI